jgi:hypothetical protein
VEVVVLAEVAVVVADRAPGLGAVAEEAPEVEVGPVEVVGDWDSVAAGPVVGVREVAEAWAPVADRVERTAEARVAEEDWEERAELAVGVGSQGPAVQEEREGQPVGALQAECRVQVEIHDMSRLPVSGLFDILWHAGIRMHLLVALGRVE